MREEGARREPTGLEIIINIYSEKFQSWRLAHLGDLALGLDLLVSGPQAAHRATPS